MNAEFIESVGRGLILLGIGFVILDFFMARFARRIKQLGVHDLSDQQLLISIAKPQERRRMKIANLNYEAAITHRMRRRGLLIMTAGFVMLIGALAYRTLTR